MRTLVSTAAATGFLSAGLSSATASTTVTSTWTMNDGPLPPAAALRLNKIRARFAKAAQAAPDVDNSPALPALAAALRSLAALPRDHKSGARAAVIAAALALLVLRARKQGRARGVLDRARLLAAARSRVHDLRAAPRDIVIVTTASLPWMTGTAVNPALRAVALAADGHSVTLVVPWLESAAEQRRVYGRGRVFSSRSEQAAEVRRWLASQGPAGEKVDVRFYDGVYSEEFGSILAVGDLTSLLAGVVRRDVIVLEEPEHLTWHHVGRAWTDCAELVVGVIHTNYLEYAHKYGALGPLRSAFLRVLNMWVCAAHCHRVIRLSGAVQRLPGAVTENVHGVRSRFLDIGEAREGEPFKKGAYFLGKALWTKGYAELLDLLETHAVSEGDPPRFDLFGSGPDIDAVRERVRGSRGLARVRVHGVVVDHASEYLQDYQVFVNASQSDVVCTATAEALAMGKNVVLLRHPSNEFFARFRNTRFYETPSQFTAALKDALANPPLELSDRERAELTWTQATQRFYDAVQVQSAPKYRPRVAAALAAAHRVACEALVSPPAHKAVRERYKRELKEAASAGIAMRRGVPLSGGGGGGGNEGASVTP